MAFCLIPRVPEAEILWSCVLDLAIEAGRPDTVKLDASIRRGLEHHGQPVEKPTSAECEKQKKVRRKY